MGKFGIKDAESLIGLARETAGIKEGVDGILLDIRHLLMQLEASHGNASFLVFGVCSTPVQRISNQNQRWQPSKQEESRIVKGRNRPITKQDGG
jgi:hypothetical protein